MKAVVSQSATEDMGERLALLTELLGLNLMVLIVLFIYLVAKFL